MSSSRYINPIGLTPSQISSFLEDGYLIIPDALDPSSVSALLSETRQMLADFSLDDHPMTKFSTGEGNDNRHVGDEYFLTSGDKIRFFFEEDAIDAHGALKIPKDRAVNKIGHALHMHSPAFRDVSLSRRNAAIMRSLDYRDPRVLQSMVICKQPGIGGRVPPHQDSTFLYTDPPSAIGFWYALEDAMVDNGCLSFLRGSHRRAKISKRFVRMDDGGTGFVDLPDGAAGWPHDGLTYGDDDPWLAGSQMDEEYTIGEVTAGSLVLIHGNLLHKSERNSSQRSRLIYTFHVIEGANSYDARNWLQPGTEGFSRLYR